MAPGWDFDAAIRANAEGTGLLLAHTRKAKAALVMSTHSTYRPHDDPMHVYLETDPLGEVNAAHAPPYSISKIAQEAVARTCARLFDLPVTIARMNASYGRNGGLPTQHVDALLGGGEVTTRWDPCMYSPDPPGRHQRPDRGAARRRVGARHHRELGGRRAGQRAGVVRLRRRARRHRPRWSTSCTPRAP